jgi:succinate-acetate transporter protein
MATVMAVLSLTWLSVGVVMLTSVPGARSPAMGLFLLLSGLAVALSGLTAALTKVSTAAVFLTAGVRIALTGWYHLNGAQGAKTTAGVIGVVLCALAVYVAWASEIEEAAGRAILPIGRRGKGHEAMVGTLSDQTKDIALEAGVRTRL